MINPTTSRNGRASAHRRCQGVVVKRSAPSSASAGKAGAGRGDSTSGEQFLVNKSKLIFMLLCHVHPRNEVGRSSRQNRLCNNPAAVDTSDGSQSGPNVVAHQ